MKTWFKTAVTLVIVFCVAFSSFGYQPAKAAPQPAPKEVGPALVLTAIGTGIAVVTLTGSVVGWIGANGCWYEIQNIRSSSAGSQDYGNQNYYASMATYTYTSPAVTWFVKRDARMDGKWDGSMNDLVKSKTGVDVMAGRKAIASQTYRFSPRVTVKYATTTASLTKFTFDVRKKCGIPNIWIWSDTLILGSTWFTAPSKIQAYYAYYK